MNESPTRRKILLGKTSSPKVIQRGKLVFMQETLEHNPEVKPTKKDCTVRPDFLEKPKKTSNFNTCRILDQNLLTYPLKLSQFQRNI